MSNPYSIYKANYIDNLPSGVTYNSEIARFFFNGKSFFTPQAVESYRIYLNKFGSDVPSEDIELAGLDNGFAVAGQTITAQRNGVDVAGPVTWRADGKTITTNGSAGYIIPNEYVGMSLGVADSGGESEVVDILPDEHDAVWMMEGSGTVNTPSVQAGDLIVVWMRRNGSTALVSGDCSPGTLRFANDITENFDNHVAGVWTYKVPASARSLQFTLDSTSTILNAGCYNFDAADGKNRTGTECSYSTGTTTTANSLVLRCDSRRPSVEPTSRTQEADRKFQFPTTNFDHRIETYSMMSEVQAVAGVTATQSLTSTFTSHTFITVALSPDTRTPARIADVYDDTANGGGLARTSSTTTLTNLVSEIDVTFDGATTVGHYKSNGGGVGDIFVLDEGSGVTINSYTPGPLTTPRAVNGAMIDPDAIWDDFVVSGVSQGWVDGTGLDAQITNYDASLRVTLPVTLTAGQTIIIHNGDENASGSSASRNFLVVTCVDTIPYADEYRPPYMWPSERGARPRLRARDINYDLIPAFERFEDAPLVAEQLRYFNQTVIDPVSTQKRLDLQTPVLNTYSRDGQVEQRDGMFLMQADIPLGQKAPLLDWYLQRGIDVNGVVLKMRYQTGVTDLTTQTDFMEMDGGHNNSRGPSNYVAGALFGDADMLALNNLFQEFDQTKYVDQDMVDNPSANSGAFNWTSDYTGFPEHVSDKTDDDDNRKNDGRWSGQNNYYRSVGNGTTWWGEILFLVQVAKAQADAVTGDGSLFDYTSRHFYVEALNDDPWILQGTLSDGGRVLVPGTPGAQGIDSWVEKMFDLYYPAVHGYPFNALGLQSVSINATSSTSARVSFTTQQADGDAYVVVSKGSAAAPSDLQFLRGQDATGSAGFTTATSTGLTAGSQTISISGLTTDDLHNVHLVWRDKFGNMSAVESLTVTPTTADDPVAISAGAGVLNIDDRGGFVSGTSVFNSQSMGTESGRHGILIQYVALRGGDPLTMNSIQIGSVTVTTDIVEIKGDDGFIAGWAFVPGVTGTTANITLSPSGDTRIAACYHKPIYGGSGTFALSTPSSVIDNGSIDISANAGDFLSAIAFSQNQPSALSISGVTENVNQDILTGEYTVFGDRPVTVSGTQSVSVSGVTDLSATNERNINGSIVLSSV